MKFQIKNEKYMLAPKYGYIRHNRINHTGYYRLFLLQSCPFYRKGSGNTRLFINDL